MILVRGEFNVPNILQKAMYNISSGAPLLLSFAFVWWSEKNTLQVPIICIVSTLILVSFMLIAFAYYKRNLPSIPINVTDVSPHDTYIIAYIISYLLPFVTMVIAECNLFLLCAISVFIILVVSIINAAMPNPILLLLGYHFYHVNAANGVSGYLLISKRKIRSAKDVKIVKRIFEFLLLDVGGI